MIEGAIINIGEPVVTHVYRTAQLHKLLSLEVIQHRGCVIRPSHVGTGTKSGKLGQIQGKMMTVQESASVTRHWRLKLFDSRWLGDCTYT